ncbi:penicillin-binding protein [Candidatus Peregrinibacteria bacterium]|nr:penicillin-binding protein [Candidatus Peregrinibacteria bacterium]
MLKRIFPHQDLNGWKKIGFWAASIVVGLVCLSVIVFAGAIGILSIGLPDVTKLENLAAAQSTQIFDSKGTLLYTIHGEENREFAPLDKISPFVVDGTVAIEDDNFWEHGGFDIWAIAKASLHELFGIGGARGGSTITQQYIKNTFLSSERSYLRKAKELILAVRLEKTYDKKKILELYLNRIPYGNNAYGIQKAAEIYFKKDAKNLTLGESAVLAALPQAPTRYNPYGDNKYSHLLKKFTKDELYYRNIKGEADLQTEEYTRGLIGAFVDLSNGKKIYIPGRSDLVLKRMNELGKIDGTQRKQALNEIQGLKFNQYKEFIKHAHFVLYIKGLLEQKYGKDVVEQGGLKVYTTLDGDLQDYAEKVVAEKGEYDVGAYGTNNAALLTINAKTGDILAMIGSRDYYNTDIDGNVNVVLNPRQPGSSFKPIVYSQLFYNGYGPGSVIEDVPTKIGASDTPYDFDGKWLGQIPIRTALGQSRNIPAIKAYFLDGQQDPIIDLATKMGITSLDKKRSYGYPLGIGAAEIPLIEMVTAYGVFATGGKRPELNPILKIENSNGDILEQKQPKDFDQVMDPQIAYLINSILSDQSVSVGSKLFISGKVNAAKTGTSTKENKKDANAKGSGGVRPMDGWTIGYTPTIVTGVWIGNTDGSGLGYTADGYNTAAPIFNDVMTKALEKMPSEPFIEPDGIKHVAISKASGKLPGPNTPPTMVTTEVFTGAGVPTEIENLFYKVKLDKISGLLATEFTPPEAVQEVTFQNYQPIAPLFNWKQELLEFYQNKEKEASTGNEIVRPGIPPIEYDKIHTAETAKKAPLINILSPIAETSIPTGNLTVEVQVQSGNGIEKVEYYIDNDRKFFTGASPFTGHISISKFLKPGTAHLIVAKVIDKLGYSTQSAIQVKIAEKPD